MRSRPVLALSALLVLAGCGTSPKTHYYMLDAVPATAPAKPALASAVTVAAVHVAPSLDRLEMMRRTGPTTVDVSDQDRWTAPLDEMVRNVLSQDLLDRLGTDAVILPNAPAPANTAKIVVAMTQFGPDATRGVVLDGSWSLLAQDRDQPVIEQDVNLRSPSSADDGASEAAAMSRLLGQLADQIAAALAKTL